MFRPSGREPREARLRILAVWSIMGLAGLASVALAHGVLDQAAPPAGSILASAPATVRLRFGERIEAAFSSIEVLDAGGERVDRGDIALDSHDSSVLQVSLKPLSPGTYTVRWRAVSVDTHATSGQFSFKVRPE